MTGRQLKAALLTATINGLDLEREVRIAIAGKSNSCSYLDIPNVAVENIAIGGKEWDNILLIPTESLTKQKDTKEKYDKLRELAQTVYDQAGWRDQDCWIAMKNLGLFLMSIGE